MNIAVVLVRTHMLRLLQAPACESVQMVDAIRGFCTARSARRLAGPPCAARLRSKTGAPAHLQVADALGGVGLRAARAGQLAVQRRVLLGQRAGGGRQRAQRARLPPGLGLQVRKAARGRAAHAPPGQRLAGARGRRLALQRRDLRRAR